MKLIDWSLSDGEALPTLNDCSAWGAGWKVSSPNWFASIVQVPRRER